MESLKIKTMRMSMLGTCPRHWYFYLKCILLVWSKEIEFVVLKNRIWLKTHLAGLYCSFLRASFFYTAQLFRASILSHSEKKTHEFCVRIESTYIVE